MNDLFEIVEDLQYAAQSKNRRIPSEMLAKWQSYAKWMTAHKNK